MNPYHQSLILIGMPGAGKSTLGLLLAKSLAKDFVDTDLLIQLEHRKTLQDILHQQGYLALREQEDAAVVARELLQLFTAVEQAQQHLLIEQCHYHHQGDAQQAVIKHCSKPAYQAGGGKLALRAEQVSAHWVSRSKRWAAHSTELRAQKSP